MAGEVIGAATLIDVSATRGGRNPLVDDLASNIADASGVLLSVLIPTCANIQIPNRRNIVKKALTFFILQESFMNCLWDKRQPIICQR
jgi:hypothetical protein